jgi:mannose-6-phosphate isomerase-like protein (cupin superfamily)
MLRSVECQGSKVTVHFRSGDVEVMVVEVSGLGSLDDPIPGGRSSWHLVLEGQALFRVGEECRELLAEQSLTLDTQSPYTILNPAPARLRLLSVVSSPCGVEPEGRPCGN